MISNRRIQLKYQQIHNELNNVQLRLNKHKQSKFSLVGDLNFRKAALNKQLENLRSLIDVKNLGRIAQQKLLVKSSKNVETIKTQIEQCHHDITVVNKQLKSEELKLQQDKNKLDLLI